MSVTTELQQGNKVVLHWKKKLESRKARRTGILDSAEEDKEHFEDSGQRSSKTFVLLDKRTHQATKKMLLKHNLQKEQGK